MARRKKLPVVLTAEEAERLLSIPNRRYPTGLRNICILKMMLNAGLRSAEVLALEPRDVDLTTGKVHVRNGKGGKDRIVWIGEGTLDDLRAWTEKRADRVRNLDRSTPLFCTLDGKSIHSGYLRNFVYRIAEKAGIDKPISPHTLRHSYATDLYRESQNLRVVQKALGHSYVSTTMLYTHIVDKDYEEALSAFRR